MKHIKYTAILIASIMISLTGCEDYLDINTDPDKAIEVPPNYLLPTILFYTSQSFYDHAEYGVYLSQALTTGGRSQTGAYAYKSGWEFLSMNRHPQWRRHYYDLGVNINSMIDGAQSENSPNYELIARTIRLQSTLLTTDAFGDIPHSQAYKNFAPAYDTQASIYEWMMQEADALLALYNDPSWVEAASNKRIDRSIDRVYGGDLYKWRAYTKAVKARLLLRKLPNWDNTPAVCEQIIAAVNDALNDPYWEEPRYHFDGGEAEKNCQWGPSQPTCNLGWAQGRANLLTEAIPSRFFGQALLGFYPRHRQTTGYALDPRADKMMTPRADAGGAKLLRYIDNNIGISTSMKVTYYPDLYASGDAALALVGGTNPYTQNTGYIAFITEEELLFIRAEAEYWKGDKVAAYNTTKEAVEKNMQRYKVKQSTPQEIAIYNKFFNIRLPGAATFTIGDLMQQKYVAMYLQAEQWTDVRRYNYSSKQNGIAYDGTFVYTVERVHDGSQSANEATNFTAEYSLSRPYNLYEAYWTTGVNYGTNARFSPNAWVNRLNYDPETEEKYNRDELIRLGAYKNPDWLRKRMIWAYKNNGYVTTSDPTEWQ